MSETTYRADYDGERDTGGNESIKPRVRRGMKVPLRRSVRGEQDVDGFGSKRGGYGEEVLQCE